jgi:hypothetical protein
MKKLIYGATTSAYGIIYLLTSFPGGTILMALSCDSHRLDGWDWVLSVIIPFYGIFKVLISSGC